MSKLSRNDLMSLEQYDEQRSRFREKVLQHKQNRKIAIGDAVTLYFEDQLTIQYQIQEMLRIEKIFESAGINEELETYNPLIPDGNNFKATFMIEYTDVEVRQKMLEMLVGIEAQTWVQITGHDKVMAIYDEDLERADSDKTSAVHFMRFQLDSAMIQSLKSGAELNAGTDHPHYMFMTTISGDSRISLLNDLE